jgi:nucleoside-diphosphate kinase
MVGATEPKGSPAGTIRGDYAHMSYGHADGEGIGIPNIMHASGDQAEAKQEIEHWFDESELHDYETVHQQFTQRQQHHAKSK